MDVYIPIAVTILLTVVNGFFSMSEMALSTAKRVVLEHDAEEGDRRAAKAAEVSSDSTSFLASIQVAITLVSFASSAFAATSLSAPIATLLVSVGTDSATAGWLSTTLLTLVLSFFSIVIGELVPKRIAMADAEGVAKSVAGTIDMFARMARPFVWLTSSTANGIAKVLRIRDADDRQDVSEEEIRYLVEDSDELSEEEKSMIQDVISLGEAIAREVMVPRVDMCFIESSESLLSVLATMRETGFSRIPVCADGADHIVGIAHIKDLIDPIVGGHGGEPVAGFVRGATFVPDTKNIIPLLSEMQASREHMILVTDEYGGTAGLLTIEDIVEEVVGEIEDEFDPDRLYIVEAGDGKWVVDGRYSISDAIEMGWPIDDCDAFETMAGFVMDLADSVPEEGTVLEKDGYAFTIHTMQGRRVSEIGVTRIGDEGADSARMAREEKAPSMDDGTE